uniref:Uncharacterized protein n=1 Tax=Lymantria dispar multicapsid nuclear polyhedrosis virus TaxID=10449 RepID=A0A140HR53_NPVLD|nr:hypothetical protein [Lymantria dispar multiple nucleopolyhedrovirus]
MTGAPGGAAVAMLAAANTNAIYRIIPKTILIITSATGQRRRSGRRRGPRRCLIKQSNIYTIYLSRRLHSLNST